MKHDDYKVGWICALPLEFSTAKGMLDQDHEQLPRLPFDDNIYSFGRIGNHNIVISCLPAGSTGTVSAAKVARQLYNSFPSINIGLLVGIGGAVPSSERDIRLGKDIQHDIRLGDIVVSQPSGDSGGVIQWDFGKTVQDGNFMRTGSLNRPPEIVLGALSSLQAQHRMGNRHLDEFISEMTKKYPSMAIPCSYPGKDNDKLFKAEYDHPLSEPTCTNCDATKIVDRPPRDSLPVIHYGAIASGNQVMRHGSTREKLGQDLGVLCFEMEAAGLMNNFPCLVVRGIADYADSHKNKHWQDYAAAVAAAYSKELLLTLPVEQTLKSPNISHLSLDTEPASTVFLTNLPPTRPWFFGRQKELSEISRILDLKWAEQKCIVLCGFGGLGKTKLAMRYLEVEGSSYDFALWIDSSTQRNVQVSFSEAAASLEALNAASRSSFTPAVDSSKVDVIFVKHWLEKTSKKWLMILDSFDDADYHDAWALLPKCIHGRIIVTSTRMDLAQSWTADILEISGLDHDSGAKLLFHQLNASLRARISHDDTNYVINELSRSPLAIEQASALLLSGLSIEDFRKHYSSKYKDIMSKKPPRSAWSYDKNKSVFETFEALHEALEQRDPNTVNLLALISFFGAAEIPLAIFLNLDQSLDTNFGSSLQEHNLINGKEDWFYKKLEWLKAWCADEYFIRITVNQLEKFCLVKTKKTQKGSLESFTVHNAVSHWGRERHVAKNAASWCLLASYALSRHLTSLDLESRRGAPATKINTHVHFTFSCISRYVYRELIAPSRGKFRHFYAYICHQFGINFHYFRQFEEAKKALGDSIEFSKIQQSSQWPIDRPSLDIMLALCDTYWELGEWEHARRLNSDLLVSETIKSEEFDNIAVSAVALGHKIRNRLDSARAAANRASKRDMLKSTPDEAPERSFKAASSNIGNDIPMERDEEYHDKLYTLKEILSQTEEMFGQNDPYTLEARLRLAQFYENHGAFTEAVIHLESICDLFKRKSVNRIIDVIRKHQDLLTPALLLLIDCVTKMRKSSATKSYHPASLNFALAYAALADHSIMAAKVLAEDVSIESRFWGERWSALQLTIYNNCQQVFDYLLCHGASCDSIDRYGSTALHTAANVKRRKMIETLLNHGAMIEAVDIVGLTPLHCAVRSNDLSVAKLLIQRGASINSLDKHGRTILLQATLAGQQVNELIEFLISQGADVDQRNHLNNRTALQEAGRTGHRTTFELLANLTNDLGLQDRDHSTPLHMAAFWGWTSAAKTLIDRKARINIKDSLQRTPLRIANLESRIEMQELLLEHGAKS